jgi:putative acetyltransferase
MLIREYRTGEESALRLVFFSSVHELANNDYSPGQIEAWAPREYDEEQWAERIRSNQPFVAEADGRAVGYADLQASGYIDQFFVAGPYAGQGIGAKLMEYIHMAAQKRRISELCSDVSLTAEPFFARHGFIVETRKSVCVRGVVMKNARMRKKRMADAASPLIASGSR